MRPTRRLTTCGCCLLLALIALSRGALRASAAAAADAPGAAAAPAAHAADVVVYGGTAGGAIAAVAAARDGASVLLLEPGRHLGGMVSGGLGATDAGRTETVGGFAREFFTRLGKHYGKSGVVWRHEPSVAEATFNALAQEAGVTVLFEHRLKEQGGVTKQGDRIASIALENGATVAGKIFVDASYEADLMAQAGVTYRVGREGQDEYGESYAGVRELRPSEPGAARDEQGLLPGVHTGDPGKLGAADDKTQAYNFRLCLTKDPANRVAIARPASYDPRRYALLARSLERSKDRVRFENLVSIAEVPNGKTDVNNVGALSTDYVNASWDYPEGSYARRAEVWQDHKDYTLGLLYFLAHDSRVPERVRTEAAQWGLAKDEFADTGHWPHQLYVREGRRMVGEYVMRQRDLREEIKKPDPVGMGSYFMDVHVVQRVALPGGRYAHEGSLTGDHRVFPYQVPYRSLVPKRGECANLLVPVCASASHVAWSSMRMEPVFMMLGHGAGVAASTAARDGLAVQDVPYAQLRPKLEAQGQVLDWDMKGRIDPAVLAGVVIDEGDAKLSGGWLTSNSGDPFVGLGYRHDNNQLKGQRIATYTPDLPAAGRYDVHLYFSPVGNRATNTPVTVASADGTKSFTVNQRAPLPKGGRSYPLGTFGFAKGTAGSVTVKNDGTDGVVVIDAVQFVPAGTPTEKPSDAAPAASTAVSSSPTTDVPPPPAGVTDAEVLAAIRHCREMIRASQLDDGGLRMQSTGANVRIVPYFSNIAAMALLAAHELDPRPNDVRAARRWIDWYVQRMEPDGTINDYAGTVGDYARTDKRDSTDSYAATFLQLLNRYRQVAEASDGVAALLPAARKAVDAIALTQEPDGLTWAKPDYKAKYLMDNLEVVQGLEEGAQFFAALGDAASASRCRGMADRVREGLASYWQPDAGCFAWARTAGKTHVRFEKWYPDGVVNAFAAAVVKDAPPALWANLKRTFADEPKFTPDWWLPASERLGTPAERARHRRRCVDFARSMAPETHQLNRLGTTVLALIGADARGPLVDLKPVAK